MRPFWKKPEKPPAVKMVLNEEPAKRRHWSLTAWRNCDVQLWLLSADEPWPLWPLRIKKLALCHEGQVLNCWTCGYCGMSNQTGSKCSACNGPRRGCRQSADLTLFGPLPHALVINGTSTPFVLEARHTQCGRADDYLNGEAVAQMHDCKIMTQQVTGFADSLEYMAQEQELLVEYGIKCQVAFIADLDPLQEPIIANLPRPRRRIRSGK